MRKKKAVEEKQRLGATHTETQFIHEFLKINRSIVQSCFEGIAASGRNISRLNPPFEVRSAGSSQRHIPLEVPSRAVR